MKILSSKARPVLDGAPVAAWVSQVEFADLVGITDRQVRNLQGLGLPFDRKRGHPLPHSLLWFISYNQRIDRDQVVSRLPLDVSILEHRAREGAAEAELKGTLRTRPRRGR